jgi:hypothetical protein
MHATGAFPCWVLKNCFILHLLDVSRTFHFRHIKLVSDQAYRAALRGRPLECGLLLSCRRSLSGSYRFLYPQVYDGIDPEASDHLPLYFPVTGKSFLQLLSTFLSSPHVITSHDSSLTTLNLFFIFADM